jgi:hypothetical protein
MESLLLENKWFFLIGAEVSFWVLSGAFLVLRYWFGSDRGSLVLLGLIVLDNLFILALGVLDYLSTGEFAVYQIAIAAVLVYGLTFGKGDMKRLDAYLKKRVARWKGQVPSEAPPSSRGGTSSAGHDKARKERQGWYKHLAVFVVGQGVLFAMGESWPVAQLVGNVPEELSALMNASRIWCVVFVVDTIWSLSYTVFPRVTGANNGSGKVS